MYSQVARHPEAVTVVTGIVGCAGLKVTSFPIFWSFLVTYLFAMLRKRY